MADLLKRPPELTEKRLEQLMGYVKAQTRAMETTYSLRPDQVKDFSQKFYAKIFEVIVTRWKPGKGANPYSFAQGVGELVKCNLAREIVKEHEQEADLGMMKSAVTLAGERMTATRDWENDEAGDKLDLGASLIDVKYRDRAAAADVKLDWEMVLEHLTPYERLVAELLWENRGNVSCVARLMGRERKEFIKHVILPIRAKFNYYYFN